MSIEPETRMPPPPLALRLIALIGAALSFNGVRLAATPHAGLYGGIGTALLFDLAMWLSSRWYIATTRAGRPLRPALWLSFALVAVTLIVNVNGAHGLADQVTHGIGPALFAAFTWLEAVMQLRAYRKETGARDRVPFGYTLVHPLRAARITLMMLGSGERSFTAAKAMCQNREAQRRVWRAEHRPAWLVWVSRTLRPGWRSKVDPVAYTAYRWAAFDANALTLSGPSNVSENVPQSVSGHAENSVSNRSENTERRTLHAVPETPEAAEPPQPGERSGNAEISALRRSELFQAARQVELWRGRRSAYRISRELGIDMALAQSIADLLRDEDQASADAAPSAPVSSGRNLTPAQVADLIRQAGGQTPGVREVMRTFAVSYDKAKAALDLLTAA
jgi:hypothetical protein